MELHRLLEGMAAERSINRLVDVSSVVCDSRQVRPGALFVALQGSRADGRDYIAEAVARGAAAVLTDTVWQGGTGSAPVVRVPDPREVLGELAGRFYGHPSRRLGMIGVTGTNGKTTTAYLIESILLAAGRPTGLLGTIAYCWGARSIPASVTTPPPLELHRLLAGMVSDGMEWCVMEVSSHALDQRRTAGVEYAAAVFTNLASDHLDYHGSQRAYFEAKLRLFAQLGADGWAVVHRQDPWGPRLLKQVGRHRRLTFGLGSGADVAASAMCGSARGVRFRLDSPWGSQLVHSPLLGTHNILNALGAVGAALACGAPLEACVEAVEAFRGVPGRLERLVSQDGVAVFVDYAHTEDGLRRVLQTLRPLTAGQLMVVFGCGGDRDRTKRPRMGAVASELADTVILTSDNPRSEDPEAILRDVRAGMRGSATAAMEPDRSRAISRAVSSAAPGDVVLLAGKGHEAYQMFKDTVVPFSDRDVAARCLARRVDGRARTAMTELW